MDILEKQILLKWFWKKSRRCSDVRQERYFKIQHKISRCKEVFSDDIFLMIILKSSEILKDNDYFLPLFGPATMT